MRSSPDGSSLRARFPTAFVLAAAVLFSGHDAGRDRWAATEVAPQPTLTPCLLFTLREFGRCGVLPVYEDRARRGGRRVALNVVVLRAREGPAALDPIFVLTHGPGVGATRQLRLVNALLSEARSRRDVVLIDTRGTGRSNPLTCALYRDGSKLQPHLSPAFPRESVHWCRAVLADRANLALYTTPIAMDDLEEVRARLGYQRINLIGIGYGGRAALVYLRRHPERVRGVVLQNPIIVDVAHPLPAARALERAIERLAADCANDPSCRARFPDPEGDLRAVLARLERGPVQLSLWSWRLGWRDEAYWTQRGFAEGIWSMLHSTHEARRLPLLLRRAAEGDLLPLARAAALSSRRRRSQYSEGARLSVLCAEDVPFIAPDDTAREASGTLLGLPLAHELLQACADWPRASLPPDYREPVRTNVPVLLLSGALDPTTTPELTTRIAQYMHNSLHLVHPTLAHADADACARSIIARFIALGSMQRLDSACLTQARRPPFEVGAER